MSVRAIRSLRVREFDQARNAIKAANALEKVVLTDKHSYDQVSAMLARIGMYAGNPQAVLKRLDEIKDKANEIIKGFKKAKRNRKVNAHERRSNRRSEPEREVQAGIPGGEACRVGGGDQVSPN